MKAPLVSVIVPNYNHAAFLEQRLNSVLAQTVADLEVILLDDASKDGSAAILHAYAARDPRITHVVVNTVNSGSPFKQWRKGLELARGTWVWIAESDDSCAPDLLEQLLAKASSAPEQPGVVYAQSMFINDQGERIGSMLRHTAFLKPDPFALDLVMPGEDFVKHYLKVKNVIPNASAVLVRRDLFGDEAIWQGTADMRLCGDWLLWSRLVSRTTLGFVAAELNAFRHHTATTRELVTIEQKKRRLLEEAMVRSALSTHAGLDQRKEELQLYTLWFRYFSGRHLFSRELGRIRIAGRSRAAFLGLFLIAQVRVFAARLEQWLL